MHKKLYDFFFLETMFGCLVAGRLPLERHKKQIGLTIANCFFSSTISLLKGVLYLELYF